MARPRDEVFGFFAEAGNLETLTPAFLNFEILTPLPIEMHVGTLIDYRLSLFAIPFRWHTRIVAFEPGRRFVDVQLSGPYALWHHLHEFEDTPDGTRVRDTVDYEPAFGLFGRLAHALFVRKTLARIFDYRRDVITGLLEQDPGRVSAIVSGPEPVNSGP